MPSSLSSSASGSASGGAAVVAAPWRVARRVLAAAGLLLLAVLGVLPPLMEDRRAMAALALANAAQTCLAAVLVHQLQSRGGAPSWRLRRPIDLAVLVAAGVASSVVEGLVVAALLWSRHDSHLLTVLVSLTVRGTVSTVVLGALTMRLVDRGAAWPLWTRRRGGEAVGAVGVFAAAYSAVFCAGSHLPLAYLLVPLSIWVAVRFSTTAVALHVVLVAVAVFGLTSQGTGPFALGATATEELLAQAYVVVVALVSLSLALHRDDRRALEDHLRTAERRAAEQADLLEVVVATTSEGITVFDATGANILRNPAAGTLVSTLPAGTPPEDWSEHYLARHPDGTRFDVADLPLTRALRGEGVTGVDLLVTSPGEGVERVLNTSAQPLPLSEGAAWSGGAVMAFTDVTAERAAAAQVSHARDVLARVLDAATSFSIISTDLHGRITVFNVGAERLTGYTEAEMLGRSPDVLHDADEVAARAAALGVPVSARVLVADADSDSQVPDGRPWTYVRKDSSRVQISLTVSAARGPDGEVTGYTGVAFDITASLAAQADLARSEQRFRLAFDTAPVGMMLVGLRGAASGRLLRVNATLEEFLGRSEADLLGTEVHDLTHAEEEQECRRSFAGFLTGEQRELRVERRYAHRDGGVRWGLLSATVVDPGPGADPQQLCLIQDITARKDAEQALLRQALHDTLTDLPNRALFADRLTQALLTSGPAAGRVGVLYLDLDGFKGVNDTAGHAAGDELLRQAAGRIRTAVRPGDTVARLGGDEFAVICPGAAVEGPGEPEAVLHHIAERLLAALRAPFELSCGTFTIGASIGVAVAAGGSADDVVRDADEAMFEAKRAGKNRVRSRSQDDGSTGAHRSRVLRELRAALRHDQLLLHGQPVVDLATGTVVAVETLVRWDHPERGLLAPGQFLDIAEDSPLMVAIGRRVLDESCRMAAGWRTALGAGAPDVHVNVSGRQVESGSLYEDVLTCLGRHGVPAGRLVLELTETHMPRVTEAVRAELQRLRDLGVRVAIDDLGTGYSSLARLTELPVDILKIDLKFVAGLGTDRSCEAVVRAILSLGRGLGLSVVAEGVETPEQADLLRRFDCATVQGYLYGRPVPDAELLDRLRASSADSCPVASAGSSSDGRLGVSGTR